MARLGRRAMMPPTPIVVAMHEEGSKTAVQMAPLLTLLDTSALSRLARGDEILRRHRVLDEVNAGRVLILATDVLTWEIAETPAPDTYAAQIETLRAITLGRGMLDPVRMRLRELHRRRALTIDEVVDDVREFRPQYDPEVRARAAAQQAGRRHGMAFAEAERATAAVEELDELARRSRPKDGEPWDDAAARAEWQEKLREGFDLDDHVRHYANTELERFAAAHGLRWDGLDVQSLPTFWCAALVHAARVRSVILERHKVNSRKGVDQLDLLHLQAAAPYGHVFVTCDRRLGTFARNIRGLTSDVVTFDDWMP